MRAVILNDAYQLANVEVETPSVGETDVLIHVATTGVCGSDMHAYRGRHPFRKPPVILGHEVAGTVVDVGAAVRGLAPGERVVVEPHAGCGDCELCRSGCYHLCPRRRAPGTGGWLGTFAEYFLAPAGAVYRLPDELPWESAVLVEPLAVGYHAARISRATAVERVAILGAGPIGLSALLGLRLRGVERVAATDLSPRKLEVAGELGATPVLANGRDVADSVTEALGAPADVVFVTTGYPAVLHDALALSGPQARIVVLSLFEEEVTLDLNPLVLGERQLVGSFVYVGEDFEAALRAVDTDPTRAARLVTHTMPLEEASRAFQMLDATANNAIKVVLTGPAYA